MRLITACLIVAMASTLAAQPARITLRSPAFKDNQPLPLTYTGYGDFKSPPLTWTGLPKSSRELALICTDPDVPLAQFEVHWLLYNIPAAAKGLPEGSRPAGPKAGHPSPLIGPRTYRPQRRRDAEKTWIVSIWVVLLSARAWRSGPSVNGDSHYVWPL